MSRVIAIGAESAGGGFILLVAIISTSTATVCLILKQRIMNNLSAQTVDYNSNRRVVKQVYNVNTDSNPAYKSATY